MYDEEVGILTAAAENKARQVRTRLAPYLLHSGLAGAYVGLGIVLIFALGTPLAVAKSPYTGLVMAAAFGIALSLVLTAGSDLFTGNTLIMAVGTFAGSSRAADLGRVWLWSWLGNLAGSVLVALLAWGAGTFADPSLVVTVASKKMSAPWSELFFRAVLCNWLVTLAVWIHFRLKSEAARLIMVWWCLLAFIGSGFEHSIANMTLLTLANLLPHGPEISWAGWLRNLIPVTLGNIASGALLTGAAYWMISPTTKKRLRPITVNGSLAGAVADAAATTNHG